MKKIATITIAFTLLFSSLLLSGCSFNKEEQVTQQAELLISAAFGLQEFTEATEEALGMTQAEFETQQFNRIKESPIYNSDIMLVEMNGKVLSENDLKEMFKKDNYSMFGFVEDAIVSETRKVDKNTIEVDVSFTPIDTDALMANIRFKQDEYFGTEIAGVLLNHPSVKLSKLEREFSNALLIIAFNDVVARDRDVPLVEEKQTVTLKYTKNKDGNFVISQEQINNLFDSGTFSKTEEG